jgi:hypothetical protein
MQVTPLIVISNRNEPSPAPRASCCSTGTGTSPAFISSSESNVAGELLLNAGELFICKSYVAVGSSGFRLWLAVSARAVLIEQRCPLSRQSYRATEQAEKYPQERQFMVNWLLQGPWVMLFCILV